MIKKVNLISWWIYFLFGIAIIFFAPINKNSTQAVPEKEKSAINSKLDQESINYLGEKAIIKRYSKELPEKQYFLKKASPNSEAAVVYMIPETKVLEITPKQPFESERLQKWLNEWDRINLNQKLADEYQSSYLAKRDVDYLTKAVELQRQSISDLVELRSISWPNSDYAYKAYKLRVISCEKLTILRKLGVYEGVTLDAELEICS
ncbi:MAG: hypothetical protein JJV97_04220 [SAR324 cluster bacterium]|nr:hypothetical protein [SAR324 cluster bacterium]